MALVAPRELVLSSACEALGTVAGVRREDEVLRAFKASHVKAQADEAMRDGNFGLAADRYTTCIALYPSGERDEKLLCNRSLAYLKAGRHALAADDAQRACALAPEWNKAWYRLGAAQAALQHHAAALEAYTRSLRLDAKREVLAAVRSTVKRLTREQLAAQLLRWLDEAQASGALPQPETEDVTQPEREEAMFRYLQLSMRDKPQPGDYYDYVALWCETPWSTGMAFIHRAAMFCRAKCYRQAAVDAHAAVTYFQSSCTMASAHKPGCRDPDALTATHIHHPGTTSPFRRARIDPLAWAWFLLGEAYTAESDHPARNLAAAVEYYLQALYLDAENPDYGLRHADASSMLHNAQQSGAVKAVYVAQGGAAARFGLADMPMGAAYRCVAALRFPEAQVTDFPVAARAVFRVAVATAAGVEKNKVLIERVRSPILVARDASGKPALEIIFQVHFGGDKLLCEAFVARCRENPAAALEWSNIPSASPMAVPDMQTAVFALEEVCDSGTQPGTAAAASALRPSNERSVVPARPLKDIELPYKSYRLTRSDGRRVERVEKHPFQLSRVYYAAHERPEEVWAELMDGSCRWRQSASEVAVIALRVPPGMRKRDLEVTIAQKRIRVAARSDGAVFLDGELERAIIAPESVWAHTGGVGEEGFVFYLKKMNLELLAKSNCHEESWWSRLFTHHAEIAWDDYEKDYSDLPEPILRKHLELEAKDACVRRLEHAEKRVRESASERDDARRRARQERLHVLRGGAPLSWVELDRLNPAVDDMPEVPVTREGAMLHAVRSEAGMRQAAVLASATKM